MKEVSRSWGNAEQPEGLQPLTFFPFVLSSREVKHLLYYTLPTIMYCLSTDAKSTG
jgi:hypothetical protein